MIDVHSHVLFGIDDGSPDINESIRMLKEAKKIGIDTIIATPHVYDSGYDIDKAKQKMEILRPHAEKIGIRLIQGYEYNCYALSGDGVQNARNFCIEGTNKLLIEFKNGMFPANWEHLISDLQWEGIDIIVAHPERYNQVQTDFHRIIRTVEMGCELQLDGLSLCSGLFSSYRKCAVKLLRNELVRWIASDAHSARDYQLYGQLIKKKFTQDAFYFETEYGEFDSPVTT